MRDMAGLLKDFSFRSLASGLRLPQTPGSDSMETLFLGAWQERLRRAHRGLTPDLHTNMDSAVAIGKPVSGDEHIGAGWNGGGRLGEIADDLALPAGARFGFAFSVNSILLGLSADLAALLGQRDSPGFGRVTLADDPNARVPLVPAPDGPIEIRDYTIYGAQAPLVWTTVIEGVYHVPDIPLAGLDVSLPTVGFKITTTETLGLGAAGGSLSYDVTNRIDADTSDLEHAVQALEAAAGIGLLGSPLGLFGEPLVADFAARINELMKSKLAAIQPSGFAVLRVVARSFPDKVLIPGTAERIVFAYDGLSMGPGLTSTPFVPRLGPIATLGAVSGLDIASPADAILAYGNALPKRVPRVASVGVVGPRTVTFAGPASPAQAIGYQALANDEVQNPTFAWSVTDANGNPTTAATLSATTGPKVTVRFDGKNVTESAPSTVLLHVAMDDDLHVKDAAGHQPTVVTKVIASRRAVPRPATGGSPRPAGGDSRVPTVR